MKTKIIGAFILLSTIGANAQSITESDLKDIRSTFTATPATKAIQNVLTTNENIKSLALNRDLQGKVDHYFKYRVSVKGITDQKSSGRCWMFTSMNVMRPLAMEKYGLDKFDFSHNYLYFWDLFEKSNLFLENIITTGKTSLDDRTVNEYFKTPVGDGGVWNLYFNAAEKYGVVPQDVMPETAQSNNTSQFVKILNERLRKGGYDLREMTAGGKKVGDLRQQKKAILADVYRILALCLGEPPTTFTWRYKNKKGEVKELKNYTPKQFYNDIKPENYTPENYIMIMNDPTRAYYKMYEIQNNRNTVEGINWTYLNLPTEDIKKAALASIKANEPMYASCDVGKQSNRETGVLDPKMYDYESLFGVKLEMEKKARILTQQSGSTHAMTLVGCDVDENDKPVKWEFENSWGEAAGNKGYLTFTDSWFNEYLFRVVIERKYLDAKAIESLKQKPIQLPVWDYMN